MKNPISRVLIAAVLFALPTLLLAFQQPAKPLPKAPEQAANRPNQKHPRGHKPAPPAVTAALHAAAAKRHGHRVKLLPKVTTPSFDLRTHGNILPTDDQGQCGDCFGVSAADGCSMALIKAGQLPLDAAKGRLSSQYGLDYTDCYQGGCDGGDEAQVIDYIKNTGMPLTSDYGPYTANPGRPKNVSGMKLWKVGDWGYCTPNQQQGIASTQDIMNCMVTYGAPISVAFDASGCDSYQAGQVMKGGGNNVDHAVLAIGWRTNTKGKIEFLGLNQWGASWGDGGTFWIEEGSYSWGTESIWVTASTLPPPPIPPDPVPPTPDPTPTPTGTLSLTGGAWVSFDVPNGVMGNNSGKPITVSGKVTFDPAIKP